MPADRSEIWALHAEVCKALADPKRLLIINELRDGPRSVGELATALGFSQPNTSQHLAVLRERGVVVANRDGTSIFYELRGDRVLKALDLLFEFMAESLDRRSQAARAVSAAPSRER